LGYIIPFHLRANNPKERGFLLAFSYNNYIFNEGKDVIPFSDEELEPAVINVIEKVRPSIKLDGGDITLIAIKEGRVFVQLQGACVGCGSSGTTIKFGVERQMKTLIHPEISVRNVPAGFENKLDELL